MKKRVRCLGSRSAALALAAVSFFVVAWPAAAQEEIEGHWVGAIEVPGNSLGIEVDFRLPESGLEGAISIPVQGIEDLALVDVGLDGKRITFRIPGIPGDPSFDGELSPGEIRGAFRQGGATLDFALARGPDRVEQARTALGGFAEFVAAAIEGWKVPGAAMVVVRGDEAVFSGGFGWRDSAAELPVTQDTLFPIGSTTKAFTTTLLGTLVDAGDLAWDAPLADYLPRFRLSDPLITSMLTPRDLVTHRSGLPRHDLVWYNRREGSRAELAARLAHLEMSAGLRARFQYNNLMFLTAGHLAEELTGLTWEEAVRSRLLEPLGMTRTNFSVIDSQADGDFSLGYRENDDEAVERMDFRDITLVGPAGSINSSAADMGRWLRFNLAGGKAGGRQLLEAATLADLHAPHMTTSAPPKRTEFTQASYGLGWSVDAYRGHRRVSHGGSIDGFHAFVALYPDDGLGLFAVVNLPSRLPEILIQHATDLVLGLEPIDWNGEGLRERVAVRQTLEEAKGKKAEGQVPDTVPSQPVAAYAGEFEHPGYGRLAFDVEEGRLYALFNGIRTPLDHWHYDVWNGAETDGDQTFQDTKFQFRADVDGIIASVESAFEPQVEPIVFRRRPSAKLSDPGFLARLTGDYALPGQKVSVTLSGSVLSVLLPGQPIYTLEPALNDRFRLKELPIISVAFELDQGGSAKAVAFHQPNGVFRAERVEKP